MRWPCVLVPLLGKAHTASPAWTLIWTRAAEEIDTKHRAQLPDAIFFVVALRPGPWQFQHGL